MPSLNDYKRLIDELTVALERLRAEARQAMGDIEHGAGSSSMSSQKTGDYLRTANEISLQKTRDEIRKTANYTRILDANLKSVVNQLNRIKYHQLSSGAVPRQIGAGGRHQLPHLTGYDRPLNTIYAGAGEILESDDSGFEDIPTYKAPGRKTDTGGIEEETTRVKSLSQAWNEAHVIQAKALTAEQYPKVIQAVTKYGMSVDHLKNVYKEASTGITSFTFANQTADGVMNKLTVTADKNGKVLKDTQKRFRGFASAIGRNIQEAIKWSIAIQLVWGPLKKVGELMEIMIANEAKLADITISLGQATSDVSNIFRVAADVADETGESIQGVLEGYELAVRATGGVSNSIERQVSAQTLLKDSMILSKLSSLSQAEAMDTLAGALRQLGLGFDSGIDLIDKWVAVSKNANVSVETLAESFAITSASASSAGLSLDELNGIITVVAENTTLSATEAGNAVRAFISGFQTNKAQKELSNFGIAVQTSTGDAIGFYDVMQEINTLFTAGIISDAQLNKIGEAIGGGARRGAQVVATIKDLGRVQEVAAVSALAFGDAEAALEIKLGTVQTKLTELGNAFQKLAQGLGENSGLLEMFKGLVWVGDGLIETMTVLTDVMGKSLPTILAVGFAISQINKSGGMGALTSRLALGGSLSKGVGGVVGKTGLAIPAILGAGITNVLQGNEAAAIGNAVGGAIGTTIGALLGGPLGATIGATIGIAIGDSFVTNILQHEFEFSEFFRDTRSEAEKERERIGEGLPVSKGKTREELLTEGIEETMADIKGNITQVGVAFVQFAKNARIAFDNIKRSEEDELGFISKEQAALGFATPEQSKRLEQLKGLTAEREGSTVVDNAQIKLARDYADELGNIKTKLHEQLDSQIVLGEISDKQYKDSKASLVGITTNVTKLYSSIGDLNAPTSDVKKQFEELAEIITYMSNEERTMITQLIGDLNTLYGGLDTIKEAGGEIDVGGEIITLADTQRDIDAKTERIKAYIDTVEGLQNAAQFNMPNVVDAQGLDRKGFDTVMARVNEEFSEEFAAGVRDGFYDGLEQTDITSTFEPFYVDFGDNIGLQLVRGVRESSFMNELKEATEEGLIAGVSAASKKSLKDFRNLSGAEFTAYAQQSVQLGQALNEAFGLDLEFDPVVAAVSDGFTEAAANSFIMQMLMRDLIDVNEKQLEGVYNLPADASFYVPFTGYSLGQGQGGGGGSSFDSLMSMIQDLIGTEKALVTAIDKNLVNRVKTTREEQMEKYRYGTGVSSEDAKQSELLSNIKQMREEQMELYRYAAPPGISDEKLTFESIMEKSGQAFIDVAESKQSLFTELFTLLKDTFFGGWGASKERQTGDLKSLDKALDFSKKPIETSLSLDITSNTILQVDGQVLADIVKNYLYEDLITQEDRSTTATQSVVI